MPTTAQIIAALTVESAIEDQLVKKIQERTNKLNSLIGKKYVPQDNSYISEIVKGERMNYHCSLIGVPCRIISRPYITEVNTCTKDKRERMIKVQSLKTGLIYEVPFAESWIRD